MRSTPASRFLPRLSLPGVFLILVLLIAACGGDSATEVPTAQPTSDPAPTIAATQGSSSSTPSPVPDSTLSSTADPNSPLVLELLAPEDGIGVEVDAVRVTGNTRIDAVVSVNGMPVEVSSNGSFQYDLILQEGANLVEVTATTLSDESASQDAAVFFISTAAGLPFTLFYPPDGLTVAVPNIPVFGGTSPGAVVGVNGVPVAINGLGIFSTTVTLEEGANFIEVLATDNVGNVRFQTVGIFYLP